MEKSAKAQEAKIGFRNVVYLALASLFTDISSEMILGVLPFFVLTELKATKSLLGLMEGTAESLNYIFRVLSGLYSDKVARRKPFILAGYALSTIAKPFFAISSTWSHALVVRFADRTGKGIRTSPRDALIGDSVAEHQRGRAFGLHRSMDQIGAVIGPTIAFILIPLVGIRSLFLLSLIPGAIAVIIILLLVRDRKLVIPSKGILKNAKDVLNRRFAVFLLVIGIFSLGAYNFSFVLVKAGTLGVDEKTIPLVYAILNVATVLAGFPSGFLADIFGKGKVLIIALMLFAISNLMGLMISTGAIFAFLIAFVYGLYLGISETVQRALIPSFASGELKGSAYGIYYLLVGTCVLIANVVVGTLWDLVSANAAFTYSMITSVVAMVGLAIALNLKSNKII